jgi:putative membrane protein
LETGRRLQNPLHHPVENKTCRLKRSGRVKKSNVLITVAITVAVLAGAFFVYRQCVPFYGGRYGGYHMGGGLWFVMPLFWVLLIVAAFSLLGRSSCNPMEQDRLLPDPPDALEILKQRYAKGEIDKAEFRAKAADIRET